MIVNVEYTIDNSRVFNIDKNISICKVLIIK